MKCLFLIVAGVAFLRPATAQEVGQGAPPGIDVKFLSGFFRGSFQQLVSLPPLGNVRRLGSTGYVQEFADARKNSANTFALVKADGNQALGADVYQMLPGMYSYYSTVGVATAGYPTMDTASCPTVPGVSSGVCSYSLFSSNHALFVTTESLLVAGTSASYTVKDPFYTRWAALGGITFLGPATSAEVAVTSKTGITGNAQQYLNGAIYSLTSGAYTGKTFVVSGKIFTLFNQSGLHTGSLGIPLSDELNVGSGRIRQNFEGGSIEYTATTDAVIRPGVGAVGLNVATTSATRMNVGEQLTIRAIVQATVGGELTDRDVTWITSNGRVVSITPNGYSATLKAVGGGTANITAVADGKSSSSLTIFVAAPCCQIGEGAPTTAIQQSFQDTATRFRLNVALPAANPVVRSGLGYIQELQSAANPEVRYLLCRSDRSPGVFLVTGDVLAAYIAESGPIGRLAYPTSDETASGRQMFEGGALAGRPVQTVLAGALLDRWGEAGFDTGRLGPPVTAGRNYLSFTGATGVGQSFRNGFLFRNLTGQFASTKAVLVQGAFLTRYLQENGPEGDAGFPFTDEYLNPEGRMQQDFEGGALVADAGGAVELSARERKPVISVTPLVVTAGGRVRHIVGGFSAGARLRITFNAASGLAPFEVTTVQGSYTWESPVPSTTRTGTVTVTASEVGTETSVAASYTVTALNEASLQLTKTRGDTQRGVPGARLPLPVTITLADDKGSPLVGIAVRFAASPNSNILNPSAVTDEFGQAQAFVRLQPTEGIVLVTAEAGGRVVTFSAQASATSFTNFPKQTRLGSTSNARENLLAAVSSILRYQQARSELPASLGLSDPATLGDFLKNFCVLDTAGGQLCDGFLPVSTTVEQLPNPWRLKEFVGGNLDIEAAPAEHSQIVDWLALGSPVLVALEMRDAIGVATTHFVVATGVASDGAVLIHDPEPQWNRTRLSDYQAGFLQWKGAPLTALRLVPRSPSPTSFLLAAYRAAVTVRSAAGECGLSLSWPLGDGKGGRASGTATYRYCAGLERTNLVQTQADGPYQAALIDLANPGRRHDLSGSGSRSFLATRPNSQWEIGPVAAGLDPSGIVNAASLTPDFAPGSLISVFGVALADSPADTVVEIDGAAAATQSVNPFRVNVEVPRTISPGAHQLRILSPFGIVDAAIQVQESAPAIFVDAQTKLPMILNAPGGAANTSLNPALRGSAITIYATGLGALRQQGNTSVAASPVTVQILDVTVPASSVVAAPGLVGVYAVTVTVPASLAPGLDLPLRLSQTGVDSNVVRVSVR